METRPGFSHFLPVISLLHAAADNDDDNDDSDDNNSGSWKCTQFIRILSLKPSEVVTRP